MSELNNNFKQKSIRLKKKKDRVKDNRKLVREKRKRLKLDVEIVEKEIERLSIFLIKSLENFTALKSAILKQELKSEAA